MSKGGHELSSQSPDSPRTDNRGPVRKLIKIAALAAQAHSNPKFDRDNTFALKILRDARNLTRPWLEEVEEELRRYGILHDSERGLPPQLSTKPKTSWLLLAGKMAFMQWRVRKEYSKTDKHAWRMEMLKEMFIHLEAHVGDVEREIRRLEGRAEGKDRHHKRYRRSKNRHLDEDKEENEGFDLSNYGINNTREPSNSSGLRHYRQQSSGSQEPWNPREDEYDSEDSSSVILPFARVGSPQSGRNSQRGASPSVLVHEGAQKYPIAQEHPIASEAGSMYSTPASGIYKRESNYSQAHKPQNQTTYQGQPRIPHSNVSPHRTLSIPAGRTYAAPRSRSGVSQERAANDDPVQHMPPPTDGFTYQAEPLSGGPSSPGAAGHLQGQVKTSAGHWPDRETNRSSRLDANDNDHVSGNLPQNAPYDHLQTAAMPKAPSTLSDSQYSRQTRAPTVSSVQVNPTAIYAPETPAISRTQPQNIDRTLEGARSRISAHQENADTHSRTSVTSSEVRKGRGQRGTKEAATSSQHSRYGSTRSSDATVQSYIRTGPSTVGAFAEKSGQTTALNVPHKQTHSRESSQSTKNSHRKSQRPPSRARGSIDDVLLRPLSAQNEAVSSFGSLKGSPVPPPSGKSCHAASQAYSKPHSHELAETEEGNEADTRNQSNQQGQPSEEGTATHHADEGISEASFIRCRQPEGKRKCHHTPSMIPSHCSSLDSRDEVN